MQTEEVILVDENDHFVGVSEKLEAHLQGKLHRAFSIFIFSSNKEILLQKRASNKYHSSGLWSNTCCGHPRPGETLQNAVIRRLNEEMGFTCKLVELFSFIYEVKLEKNLIEHEYDHVFVGSYDGIPYPNSNEVEDWKWVPVETLSNHINNYPIEYTHWFKLIFNRVNTAMANSRNVIL